MARPHAAMIVDQALSRRISQVLRLVGFRTRIVAHTGYGSTSSVRVLARVVMAKPQPDDPDEGASPLVRQRAEEARRGWRSFMSVSAMWAPVDVTVGDRTIRTTADQSGIVDAMVPGHGLGPGWHHATIASPDAPNMVAPVFVVSDQQTFGIVSDIDDTVIKTMLPRPFIAAWNTFIRHEGARTAVPGMATMYRAMLARHPGAPIVYLSTGAWSTVPQLTRFLRRNGYPAGALLMTDWGPTNTGWFRSGQAHKRESLRRLARELPQVRWVLIGDDGQHDPTLYSEFVEAEPERVRAIGIRVLSATEQLLSHFTPLANDERTLTPPEVPVCRASDGYGLYRVMKVALGEDPIPADLATEA